MRRTTSSNKYVSPEAQQELLRLETLECNEPNPCIRKYGRGPEGKTCAECKHLIEKKFSSTYFKCAYRGDTNGAGTDHRKRWRACAGFEKK